MKHDSPHPLGESPSSPAVCGTVRGGMTTQTTTTTGDSRDNAYGTIPVFWWDGTTPVFSRCLRDGAWWGWPDEAQLADFVEQAARAEKDDRAERVDRTIENNPEYAALYFVS